MEASTVITLDYTSRRDCIYTYIASVPFPIISPRLDSSRYRLPTIFEFNPVSLTFSLHSSSRSIGPGNGR